MVAFGSPRMWRQGGDREAEVVSRQYVTHCDLTRQLRNVFARRCLPPPSPRRENLVAHNMAHNDHLLESLCRDPETLSQARGILRLAQKKTGPGSGHELGAHTTGLPAICAHIASQRCVDISAM